MNSQLKSTLRSLVKEKLFALITILGLGLGLCCCLTIYFIVQQELSHDEFHQNKDSIYRLVFDERPSGRPGARVIKRASPPAGPTLKQNIAEVENYVRLRYSDMDVITYEGESFYEKGLYYVDSTFFNVFSFDLKYGNKSTALLNKNSVVLSEEFSQKYFGNENPVGKILELNNETQLSVTGVFDGPPKNTHLKLNFVVPFHAFEVPFGYPVTLNDWSWVSFHTYLLLEQGSNRIDVEAKFASFIKSALPANVSERFTLTLQPLSEIYMDSSESDQIKTGSYQFVFTLIAIAGVLLILATLNYINLNTARLITKSKAIGVRKILGATRIHIIQQFLIESMLLMLISSAIAIILFLGVVHQYIDVEASLMEAILFTLIIALPLGSIASILPIWSSNKLNSLDSIKGKLQSGKWSINLRKSLIVIQFVITLSLIASSILIERQISYMGSKNLGYTKDQILYLQMQGDELRNKLNFFQSELSNIPGVSEVSFSGNLLDGNQGNVSVFPEGSDNIEGYPMNIIGAHPGWLDMLEVELLSGHLLTNRIPLDSSEIVINEAALAILESSPEDILGQKLRVGRILEGKVVGVVRDFNFASLHSAIRPLVIFHPRTNMEYIFIKTATADFSELLEDLRDAWSELAPNQPFSYSFLDETVEKLYAKERYFQGLIEIFTYIAISLAVFGLYGLVSFVIQLELKNIAIRKVLGASKMRLYLKQLRDFLMLIVISLLIGVPIVITLMSRWLNNFAYNIEITAAPFVLSLVILSIIVVLTISHLLLKAVRSNPLKIIRSE